MACLQTTAIPGRSGSRFEVMREWHRRKREVSPGRRVFIDFYCEAPIQRVEKNRICACRFPFTNLWGMHRKKTSGGLFVFTNCLWAKRFGRAPRLKNRVPAVWHYFLKAHPRSTTGVKASKSYFCGWGVDVLSFAIPWYGIEGGSGAYNLVVPSAF